MRGDETCTFTKWPWVGSALASGAKVTAVQALTQIADAIRNMTPLTRRMVSDAVEAALQVVVGIK